MQYHLISESQAIRAEGTGFVLASPARQPFVASDRLDCGHDPAPGGMKPAPSPNPPLRTPRPQDFPRGCLRFHQATVPLGEDADEDIGTWQLGPSFLPQESSQISGPSSRCTLDLGSIGHACNQDNIETSTCQSFATSIMKMDSHGLQPPMLEAQSVTRICIAAQPSTRSRSAYGRCLHGFE